MNRFLVLVVFFSLVACEIPESIKTLTEDQSKELTDLNAELSLEAEKLSACQVNSDCSVLGFTPKACGGYQDFVVASQRSKADGSLSPSTPSQDYYLYVGRLRSYQKRVRDETFNRDHYSTCEWIEAPLGRCEENKCILRSADDLYGPNSGVLSAPE